MLVVVFDTEAKAYEGKQALDQLDNEGSIAVYADAVIAKNANGSATVKQSDDQGPLGLLAGTTFGALIGLLGGPVGLAIGATAGLVTGSLVDVNTANISEDFVEDVIKELTPGKFAVVANIQEEWTTPVDLRMEAIGGKVFRRALSDVKHTIDEEETAAMKADMAQLKAEHAAAQADRKAKLQEKINQLASKIQARLEKDKEQRAASEREAKAKAEVLKTKAAALKAKATEISTHV
jgi:uncharacterized membrane protein